VDGSASFTIRRVISQGRRRVGKESCKKEEGNRKVVSWAACLTPVDMRLTSGMFTSGLMRLDRWRRGLRRRREGGGGKMVSSGVFPFSLLHPDLQL